MPFDVKCKLWPNGKECFFAHKTLQPMKQAGPRCVVTALAILTDSTPEIFEGHVNTQDPISWSEALKPFGMKLAYCPSDIRKLRFYVEELIGLDDLFLLCYYSPTDAKMLGDPDERGWICGSHVVILHRDHIIDPRRGDAIHALDHDCLNHHTKRLFRVLPVNHPRGI
ncbi:MAG: hypothetical protein FJ118_19495 [Deltaproteobacteria bacterium]|nr:hypothetical protein [Deltaproteobacteria bacterium]